MRERLIEYQGHTGHSMLKQFLICVALMGAVVMAIHIANLTRIQYEIKNAFPRVDGVR